MKMLQCRKIECKSYFMVGKNTIRELTPFSGTVCSKCHEGKMRLVDIKGKAYKIGETSKSTLEMKKYLGE